MTVLDARPQTAVGSPLLRTGSVPLRPVRPARVGRAGRWVLLPVLLLIGLVHSLDLAGWPGWFDDEGTYYSQAWATQHLHALAPYTYWYDHPPVGWLQIAALSWIPQLFVHAGSQLLAGRVVMVGYTLVSAALLHVLARRLGMSTPWATVTVLLWGLDPLVLFEGRQVFLDNVALPWLLGAFVLALNRRQDLGSSMAAGFCFALAVLSKETTFVFVVPLLFTVWQTAYGPTRRFAVVGFTAVLTMTGSMYLLFAAVRGELFPGRGHVSLWDALVFQFGGRASSGSPFVPDTADGINGGAYKTFHAWLHLDPYLLVVGVAAAVVVLLLVRPLRAVGLAVVIVALVGLRPGGYLPQMYVVTLLPFCALAIVGLLHSTWQRSTGLRGRALGFAAAFLVLATLAAGLFPAQRWQQGYQQAFTTDVNAPHTAMLQRVAALPRQSRIAVDNTYWNDLVAQGRPHDDVVWFYKVDADATVLRQIGGSYLGLDYLVWTDYMSQNAGPQVSKAYQQSMLVSTVGTGTDRVQLRRVLTPAQYRAREKAKADAVRLRLAAKQKALDAFFARRSDAFPGLTNGQIEGLRADARRLSLLQLAVKYQTTEATVQAVLRAPVSPERTALVNGRTS